MDKIDSSNYSIVTLEKECEKIIKEKYSHRYASFNNIPAYSQGLLDALLDGFDSSPGMVASYNENRGLEIANKDVKDLLNIAIVRRVLLKTMYKLSKYLHYVVFNNPLESVSPDTLELEGLIQAFTFSTTEKYNTSPVVVSLDYEDLRFDKLKNFEVLAKLIVRIAKSFADNIDERLIKALLNDVFAYNSQRLEDAKDANQYSLVYSLDDQDKDKDKDRPFAKYQSTFKELRTVENFVRFNLVCPKNVLEEDYCDGLFNLILIQAGNLEMQGSRSNLALASPYIYNNVLGISSVFHLRKDQTNTFNDIKIDQCEYIPDNLVLLVNSKVCQYGLGQIPKFSYATTPDRQEVLNCSIRDAIAIPKKDNRSGVVIQLINKISWSTTGGIPITDPNFLDRYKTVTK